MGKRIHASSRIRWRYQLSLADGQVVESHADPAGDVLQLGQGEMHSNIEQALLGLQAGEHVRLILLADQAFGYPDPAAVQIMPRTQFAEVPPVDKLMGFTLPSGQEIPGRIVAVDDTGVTVDFNHPLAGHNITLEVEILQVDT